MAAGVLEKGGGSRRRGRRSRSKPMAEINVTPFVDVMLVLLIIFMVAAPLQIVGVPVELPRTAAQSLPTEQEQPLTITLTADGATMIQSTEVTDGDIIGRLQAILTERTSDRVFLRADTSVPYGRVATVMGAMNAAGITNIGLVTDDGGPRLNGQGG
ncbi:ExbD/TolR family protein [uncultured Boseongicola sp.]|jgi:biopolymer transport protein TolR|uniref:ExbD/TolR family protein n=1 Tax=uncultured Boseongicola sp. TaxID=1648499 RepID=UPI00261A7CA4|nr:ExbD/TolR family protein [uncultured Boseongicola sp.]